MNGVFVLDNGKRSNFSPRPQGTHLALRLFALGLLIGVTVVGSAGCTGVVIDGGGSGNNNGGGGNGGGGSGGGSGACGATSSTPVDGNCDTTLSSDRGKTFGEPNGEFSSAVFAIFDTGGQARLQGTVSVFEDLDVFALGPLARGTGITVDTDTSALGSNLDVSVALFDADFRLVNNNDDRAVTDLDALMDWVVYNDSDEYYLVVSHSAFAATGTFTGGYTVNVQLTADQPVPAPTPQTLLLNFDGATVTNVTSDVQQITPFDAGSISQSYAGMTESMKQDIVASVRENFEGFDIEIITSDDPPPAGGTQVSEMYLGGFSETTFGIAESVDLYNFNRCDDGIIFTESFSPRQFGFTPSAAALAVAIGNVTAHEAGHLLGLNHVDDDDALMDDVSPAAALLADQEFMSAPVSDDIIPIGFQDSVFLLSDIVGLR